MRMVTALVRVKGETAPLPVKTRTAIPKELIFDVLGVLKETEVEPPIGIGDVVVENVCGTGVDVIASANR